MFWRNIMKTTKNLALKSVLLTTITLATIAACAGSGESKLSLNEDSINKLDTSPTNDTNSASSNPSLDNIINIESDIFELALFDESDIISTSLETHGESSAYPTQHTLYFPTNISDVNSMDFDVIKQHAEFLLLNPDIMVNINGHADSQGGEKYNMNLSKKRADAIAEELTKFGVPETQLILAAYGEAVPATTEDDWDANRRVELEYSDLVTVSSR